MRARLLFPLLLISLLALPAHALRVEFSGVIDTANDPQGLLPGLGTPFSGSAEYDPTAFFVGQLAGLDFAAGGTYVWPGDIGPIFGLPIGVLGPETLRLTGSLGDLVLQPAGGTFPLPLIQIQNNLNPLDFPDPNGPIDFWQIPYATSVPAPVIGSAAVACSLSFVDPSAQTLTSVAFFTPTSLSAFPIVQFTCSVSSPSGPPNFSIARVSGDVSSYIVTPEPRVAALLLLTAACTAGFRELRRQR